MEVRNVRWVGIRTDNYEAMVGFLRDILGLKVNFEEPTTVEFTTSEGDQIQVMAPGDPYYDFFGEHANGPVPLFEVDDVHSARRGASIEVCLSRTPRVCSGSHEAEFVSVRVCNRELSSPIRRIEERLHHCDPVLQLDPECVRVVDGEVEASASALGFHHGEGCPA